jgi:hypothetical protein
MEGWEMTSNKRRFRRISLKTVMTATDIVTNEGDHVRRTYQLPLEDISAGGLRYTSKFPIPVGTKLELLFQLADRKVCGTVEVVRTVKNSGSTYDIGCQFVSINPVAQEDIIKFVTLSSVREAQPSFYYSKKTAVSPANHPITCASCRCSTCADKEACRSCYKENCGRRYCRMYTSGHQDFRRRR